MDNHATYAAGALSGLLATGEFNPMKDDDVEKLCKLSHIIADYMIGNEPRQIPAPKVPPSERPTARELADQSKHGTIPPSA